MTQTTIEIVLIQNCAINGKKSVRMELSGSNDLELMIDSMRSVAVAIGYTPQTAARINLTAPIEEPMV